jgi:hypothetical protein
MLLSNSQSAIVLQWRDRAGISPASLFSALILVKRGTQTFWFEKNFDVKRQRDGIYHEARQKSKEQ